MSRAVWDHTVLPTTWHKLYLHMYSYCRYEQSFEEVMEFEDADPDNVKIVEKYFISWYTTFSWLLACIFALNSVTSIFTNELFRTANYVHILVKHVSAMPKVSNFNIFCLSLYRTISTTCRMWFAITWTLGAWLKDPGITDYWIIYKMIIIVLSFCSSVFINF